MIMVLRYMYHTYIMIFKIIFCIKYNLDIHVHYDSDFDYDNRYNTQVLHIKLMHDDINDHHTGAVNMTIMFYCVSQFISNTIKCKNIYIFHIN